MSVLITGAAGRIGLMLRQRLPGHGWTMRYFDVAELSGPAAGMAVTGDINDPQALDRAFVGGHDPVQAVVHLGGQPAEAPWAVIREANIEGTFSVFEAARRHGVRRVVYASSNHAVGFSERADSGSAGELADDTPPRPDTLYGVSKVFGEALGRYYVERYGFQVACLRIGSCNDAPATHRELATWCSPDDIAGLVDAALRKADLTFETVWAVSANRDRWWSDAGMRRLGHPPADDAARSHPRLLDQPEQVWESRAGGVFTTPAYGIDEVAARY